MTRSPVGSLAVVGTGFQVAGQVTIEALAEIRRADQLFYVASDPATRQWLEHENPKAESLADAYAPRRHRADTYAAMAERIMSPVRAGLRVCAAFYGHPGVFVTPSHAAIQVARAEGYRARMLPAISAEDCLFADLELDPMLVGCQSYEATSFVRNHPTFDPDSALVLWQIGAIGVTTYKATNLWSRSGLVRLTNLLGATYASDHPIVVYEGADLPLVQPRIDHLSLVELASSAVTTGSTLYIPPQRFEPLDTFSRQEHRTSEPCDANHKVSGDCGTLTIVGTGHGGKRRVDQQTLAHLRRAERLFYSADDPAINQFLRSCHSAATDLSRLVVANESEDTTSHRIERTVLNAVREGRRVCAAFEGHPAIGGLSALRALRKARAEGFRARMLPAVSLEDCLVADLGVDPATRGRTLYDATTFAHRSRLINTAAALVLIRIGAITQSSEFQVLCQSLKEHYPDHQPATIYETPSTSPLPHRGNTVPIGSLAEANLGPQSHLYIPPAQTRNPDPHRRARLVALGRG